MATRKAIVSRREDDLFDHYNDLNYVGGRFLAYVSRYKFPRNEKLRVFKAFDFAKLAHNGQTRDEGPPYVIHPIRVANILMHELMTMKADMICAALLHDVIEDCDITVREIKNNFNETVAQMVKLLTKDPKWVNAKRVYFQAIVAADESVRLLKLCDRLDNLRSLRQSQNKSKIRRYVTESEKRYLPLADDLNRYLFKEIRHEISFLKNKLRK